MSVAGEHGAFQRPVSPVEWWLVGHPAAWTPTIQLVVEGRGRIEHERLAQAVAAAGVACPGSRLTRRGRLWVDSGNDAPIRRLRADSGSEITALPEVGRVLTGPAHCEVLLVESLNSAADGPAQSERTAVVFRTAHAVMDGAGLLIWATEVFRALRGEVPVPAADATTEADVLETARAAARRTQATESAPLLGVRPARREPRFRWQRRVVDGYHPALVAKAAAAITAGSQLPVGRFSVPVDLRRHAADTRSTGNLSQSIVLDVPAGESWQDAQERLIGMLAAGEELAHRIDPAFLKTPLPLLRLLNKRADDKAAKTGRYPSNAALSHLGRVESADFHTDLFSARAVYPLSTLPLCGPPELNLLEVGGHTEITLAWHEDAAAEGLGARLLDQVEEALSPRAHRVLPSNSTARAYEPATLTDLFAEQVRRTPDAVAVSAEDGDISYRELDRRAQAVAAELHARGVGRDQRVGVLGGRTTAAITAIWGVLKAGAAYLPIDSTYPAARVASLLADAQCPVCLHEPDAPLPAAMPEGCAAIDLGTLATRPPAGWRDVPARPEDLANIIYTSGSTGAPKASEIEHRALVNYVRWVTREAKIDATTRMPLVASISFDMAGCAIFLPLLSGGAVLPVRTVDALSLREVLEERGGNALSITPSHLDLINQCGVRHSDLRVVMTAGELLRRSTALRAQEVFGPALRILCQWGPSETTIVNTSHEFDPEHDTAAGVPFGPPMDNNTVYVLDPAGRHVEPGEPGEAHVGGIQLARGYLGRPELTRQRFVHLADGTRVYRTGDLVRMLPDGGYAFVARTDEQVKVRGHRIEPAEVAYALEQHGKIRQAAVVARSRPGREEKELCAYVVAEAGFDPAEAKAYLSELLPSYLVPVAIVAVPAIPRNANGKTDVRDLPDPFAAAAAEGSAENHTGAGENTEAGDQYAGAAGDPVTAAVAAIWLEVLGAGPVPLDEHSDFHQLGGNSLLLVAMVDEVARRVVEPAGREDFRGGLGRIIREPSLGTVAELARKAASSGAATPGA